MAELGQDPRAALSITEGPEGHLVVHLAGELDLETAAALEAPLDELLERRGAEVVVDLGGVEFMDSSGIALLLRLAARFGPLKLRGVSPVVRRVIEEVGLSERLGVEPP